MGEIFNLTSAGITEKDTSAKGLEGKHTAAPSQISVLTIKTPADKVRDPKRDAPMYKSVTPAASVPGIRPKLTQSAEKLPSILAAVPNSLASCNSIE
jgi:hypothetical protein